MSFKSSKGRDVGKENIYYRSSSIGLGYGDASATPVGFLACGGIVSTPGDGFKYHLYEWNSQTLTGSFEVLNGVGEVEVMLQGGGGGGQGGGGFGGNQPPAFWPGRGGGGGATGVFTIPNLGPGDHTIEVGGPGSGGGATSGGDPSTDGFGTAGGNTTFTLSDSSGVFTAGGANGSSGSSNTNTIAGATITVNRGGGGGQSLSPGGRQPGGAGAAAGGNPEPTSLWWRPYISPGAGGAGGNYPSEAGADNPAEAGGNYGGGGGGGRGGFPGPNGFIPGAPAGSGGQGRAVVRYRV